MTLREAACTFGLRGWAVLPLQARRKRPDGSLVPKGKDEATHHLPTVLDWWERRPHANIGLNCEASGFIVLDVDPRNGGADTLHDLIGQLGELPPTIEAETGGGGQHLLFRRPGVMLRGSLGDGLDLKDNGYIVAPPSVHSSGREYAWSVDGHPEEVEMARLPEAWLQRCLPASPQRPRKAVLTLSDDPLLHIPASVYVPRLTGRSVDGCWVRCPFHKGGEERTPSLKVDGTVWSCFGACEPFGGKRVMGGNVLDLAGLLWGYPMPLAGYDLLEVKAKVAKLLEGER